MKIKTHEVCNFVVFLSQFNHKNKIRVGTEGLQGEYHGKGPQWGEEYCTEPGGRRGWEKSGRGFMESSTLSNLKKCLLLLKYSKSDAAHVLSDGGH